MRGCPMGTARGPETLLGRSDRHVKETLRSYNQTLRSTGSKLLPQSLWPLHSLVLCHLTDLILLISPTLASWLLPALSTLLPAPGPLHLTLPGL